MATIAGHTFVAGLCACGMRWSILRYADESYMGPQYNKAGEQITIKYAHVGDLNANELAEIRAAVVEEEKRIDNAMELAHR